jgi:hypothetical protein
VHLARKLLELKLIERKETKKAPSHSPDLGLFIRKSGTLIERDCKLLRGDRRLSWLLRLARRRFAGSTHLSRSANSSRAGAATYDQSID